MTFTDFNLSEPILRALTSMGYTKPTPVQQQAISPILKGSDLFGCAQTGTGKTAAFSLPIIHQLQQNSASKGCKALILAPTRELAIQINESIRSYCKFLSIKHVAIFGGVSKTSQETQLRNKPDILIATPGRLLDFIQCGTVKLNQVEYFVLDEADRMLDMGFINDVRKIIAKLPSKRQSLFFSATASPEIVKLADTILRNPVKISVTPVSSTAPLVKQSLYYVAKDKKRQLLRYVLNSENVEHAIVFTRTKRGADKVATELNKFGISSEAFHGNKSQGARERVISGFKNRKIRVLVATDIASRGIDIDRLTHVINYEIPEQAETYVHRIGRTGRAGASGTAMSFCSQEEISYMKDINKLTRQNIKVITSHPYSV